MNNVAQGESSLACSYRREPSRPPTLWWYVDTLPLTQIARNTSA